MKNANVCLLCLLLGAAGGYGLSGFLKPNIHESVKGKVPKLVKTSGQFSAAAKPLSSQKEASTSSNLSVAELMEELLADFDSKSAHRAAKKLSVQELKTALALLAAKRKGQEDSGWALALGESKNQDLEALRSVLFIAWAASDPHAAWQAALVESNGHWNTYLLSNLACAIAKTDPLKAVDLALGISEDLQRKVVLSRAIKSWSLVDVGAAVAYANTHPEEKVELDSFSEALTILAATEPLQAANLAISIKGVSNQSSIFLGLMEVWVERDFAAAFKWAQELTETELREDATSYALIAWGKRSPSTALNFVQTLSDNDARIKSFCDVWSGWFHQSPEAAISYLSSPKEEKLLETVSHQILSEVKNLSPKERLAILAKIPEGQTQQQMYKSLAGEHIRAGQYNEALGMLNALPDSIERDRQITQLGQAWARTDFPAATKWLKMQPDSSDRDLALTGYAVSLVDTNAAAAIAKVNTISDPMLRRDALKVIAFRWYQTDAAQTETWMGGAGRFSEEDKKFVRFKARFPGDYLPLTPTVSQRR